MDLVPIAPLVKAPWCFSKINVSLHVHQLTITLQRYVLRVRLHVGTAQLQRIASAAKPTFSQGHPA
jgi:hypothetical protein